MSDIREEKAKVVEEIKAKIQESTSIVLVNYMGLTVAQDTALRASFRNAGVEYKVLKNRLLNIAFNELGYDAEIGKHLEGPTAVAFAKDAVSAAKVVADNMKTLNKLEIKCGVLDGAYITEDVVKNLASIPSKEVLLAQLLGLFQAPVSGFARAIKAVADAKAE